MKKGILIMMTLLLAVGGAQAMGPIDFGVKAGVNTGNFDLNKKTDMELANDARVGYHAGVFARIDLLGLHVQPELLYNWNGYDIKPGDGGKSKVKVQTLEVPVLAGIQLLFLRLNAGPVFNVMSKATTSKGVVDDMQMAKPTVSFAAGLGIDLMQFSIDMRYCGQFRKTDSTITIANEPIDVKNNFRGWQFSLGYKF